MDVIAVKIAALKREHSIKQLGHRTGIGVGRMYRLVEGLAVPTEEELARIAAVTGLSVEEVRGDSSR